MHCHERLLFIIIIIISIIIIIINCLRCGKKLNYRRGDDVSVSIRRKRCLRPWQRVCVVTSLLWGGGMGCGMLGWIRLAGPTRISFCNHRSPSVLEDVNTCHLLSREYINLRRDFSNVVSRLRKRWRGVAGMEIDGDRRRRAEKNRERKACLSDFVRDFVSSNNDKISLSEEKLQPSIIH